jgi:Flavodoxin
MKAVVIYESMFGNTHLVADAVAEGLRAHAEVVEVPLARARDAVAAGGDLVVVGGPTHAFGMSRATTREGALEQAHKPGHELPLDPDAPGPGLREWLGRVDGLPRAGAAFDTRVHMPAALTGRASRGIARQLRRHGTELLALPESFFVTKQNALEPDEAARARAWGDQLGTRMQAAVAHPH